MKKSARRKRIKEFEPNIAVIKCKEGDVVCFKTEYALSVEHSNKIHKSLKEVFPKNEILILDRKAEISIIQKF